MSVYLDPFSDISAVELGCTQNPPFVIRGPGVAAYVNGFTGTLGYGNNQPGLRINGVEFLAPGSPFEGFTVDGWITANNVSGVVGKVCASGEGSQGRTRIKLSGLTVIHVYEAINSALRCTVTLINTSERTLRLRYARFIDPDPTTDRSMNSEKVGWVTTNRCGSNQVSASHENGTLRMRIDTAGFATGTGASSNWSQDFSTYFNGSRDTPGDFTIGVAVNFGSVQPGESVTAMVTYF